MHSIGQTEGAQPAPQGVRTRNMARALQQQRHMTYVREKLMVLLGAHHVART